MKCRISYVISLISSVIIVLPMNARAFDNRETHPAITEIAILESNLNDYLINYLGVSSGIKTRIPLYGNDAIFSLLKKGSTDEDSPNCRAQSHFHNPILPWVDSYMSDQPWSITVGCAFTEYSTKYSNITWATGQYLKGGPVWPRDNQDMGWDDARDNYYYALKSESAEDRETEFGKTFEALGHVMHLLEDMAVPAHTRNDFEVR